ncbi:MAG: DsbA family protein [Candidatus Nitrosopelagicus sp.]|nr:DsbA family protein [Candidatus Nitrosopelagicus sp.]
MPNTKKIGVGIVAVILVAAVTISFSSYMSEFDNAQNTLEHRFEIIALGSETATVTIVEVGDYQCEMCKLWFEKTRPQIIENYIETGKANLIFIDMPFLGQDSLHAAAATYCADDQDEYWDYHVKLYQLQQHVDDGWANIDRLHAIAFSLDMDMAEFDECMKSSKPYDRVNFHKQKAKTDFGANSTPTFVIINTSGDSKKIVGAHPYSTFEEIINSML